MTSNDDTSTDDGLVYELASYNERINGLKSTVEHWIDEEDTRQVQDAENAPDRDLRVSSCEAIRILGVLDDYEADCDDPYQYVFNEAGQVALMKRETSTIEDKLIDVPLWDAPCLLPMHEQSVDLCAKVTQMFGQKIPDTIMKKLGIANTTIKEVITLNSEAILKVEDAIKSNQKCLKSLKADAKRNLASLADLKRMDDELNGRVKVHSGITEPKWLFDNATCGLCKLKGPFGTRCMTCRGFCILQPK